MFDSLTYNYHPLSCLNELVSRIKETDRLIISDGKIEMLPTIAFTLLILFTILANCDLKTNEEISKKKNKNDKHHHHGNPFKTTTSFPIPHRGNVQAHDPNILFVNNTYYLFHGGEHISVNRATNLSGPWTAGGTVLSRDSVIRKPGNSSPWAPTVVEYNSIFYCYYCLSTLGEQNSAIGVATTKNLEYDTERNSSFWEDHGVVIETGGGPLSKVFPFNESNAIDPAFVLDVNSHKPYLVYGSYWTDIWQVPLRKDALSVEHPFHPDAAQLAFKPLKNETKAKPLEGSFMYFKDPYYYLWFTNGQCCGFDRGFPPDGHEYVILFSFPLLCVSFFLIISASCCLDIVFD